MMPKNPERPLAAHVQAAIAAGQAKRVRAGCEIAPHVRNAVQRSRVPGQFSVAAPAVQRAEFTPT